MRRNIIKIISIKESDDDGYIEDKKENLLAMMWEITKDTWSFMGDADAEQRLQRNVTAVVRRKG